MGASEVITCRQPSDKATSSGSHTDDPDVFWLSSSSRTSGDSSEERDDLFDQFITIDDNDLNLACSGLENASASSMDEEATLAQLLLEDMEKFGSTEATTSSETDQFLAQLTAEAAQMTEPAVSPLAIPRQRPRPSVEQNHDAADPFTPGRHLRLDPASSISYAELLKIEGLSMHSPGVPVPAPLSVPRRTPASPQTPSPQKRTGRRLEGIYSSLRRATHSIRNAHQSNGQSHTQKQQPRHRQFSQAQPATHFVGSVADLNLASGFGDDDPFVDPAIQDTPLATPVLAYPPEAGLASAADFGGVSTARFPPSSYAHAPVSAPAHSTSFFLPEPPLLDVDGLPLHDDGLMIHMPQPLPGNSTLLADGLPYQHVPVPPMPTTALPIHTHTRRHGPKAPSSGARYAGQPSQAPLTSPRKRSSGSGSGSGPSGGTSPSPRKGSVSMRRTRSGSFGAAHHSAAGRGEVRKRRSCSGLGRAASGGSGTGLNGMASTGGSTPRSASGSSFSSASDMGGFGGGGGGGGGFVNFTMDDSQFLMTGVAPSGSSKTKARREKEVSDRLKSLSEALAARGGGDIERLKAEGIVI